MDDFDPEKDTDAKRDEVLSHYEPFVAAARHLIAVLDSDTSGKRPRKVLLDIQEAALVVAKESLYLEYAYLSRDDDDDRKYDKFPTRDVDLTELKLFLDPLVGPAKQADDDYEPNRVPIHLFINDLQDVYDGLMHGLEIWDLGSRDDRIQACWQWRLSKSDWQQHLYRSMLANNLIRFHDCDGGFDFDEDSNTMHLRASKT